MYLLDDYASTDGYKLKIDNYKTLDIKNIDATGVTKTHQCADGGIEDFGKFPIRHRINHVDTQVTLKFESQYPVDTTSKSFGIRNLVITWATG